MKSLLIGLLVLTSTLSFASDQGQKEKVYDQVMNDVKVSLASFGILKVDQIRVEAKIIGRYVSPAEYEYLWGDLVEKFNCGNFKTRSQIKTYHTAMEITRSVLKSCYDIDFELRPVFKD